MADWDGDGDVDLFVGGRVRGHYRPASSQWYQNQDGQWVAVTMPEIEDLFRYGQCCRVHSALGRCLARIGRRLRWGEVIVLENRAVPFAGGRESGMSQKSRSLPSGPQEGLVDQFGIFGCRWGRPHGFGGGQLRSQPPMGPFQFSPLGCYQLARGGILPLIEVIVLRPIEELPNWDWGHLSGSIPWLGQAFTSFTEFS